MSFNLFKARRRIRSEEEYQAMKPEHKREIDRELVRYYERTGTTPKDYTQDTASVVLAKMRATLPTAYDLGPLIQVLLEIDEIPDIQAHVDGTLRRVLFCDGSSLLLTPQTCFVERRLPYTLRI